MWERSHKYQPLVKDERDDVSFLMETNQDIKRKGLLDFESTTDSTALDGDSGGTFDSIFNETDQYSPIADALFVDVITVADTDVFEPAKVSVEKLPCMSGKSAILLSEEETSEYYPNSLILESSERNERKTTKPYSRSFSLRRANQVSQFDYSIEATKRSSSKKNKKTGTKSNFSPLADGVNGSTGGRNSRRLSITLVSLFCFRKKRAKNEPDFL
jgi:hypothetical protein